MYMCTIRERSDTYTVRPALGHANMHMLLSCRGAPGDVELGAGASSGVVGAGGVGAGVGLEDIPGVPSEAWVRVQRGVPPADPYTPGDNRHSSTAEHSHKLGDSSMNKVICCSKVI